MCGICGVAFADCQRSPDPTILQRMKDILFHRGPDGEGTYVGPGIGLGIRRLSVIDLLTGNQPIANEDRTVWAVCNGEIYNAPELRKRLQAAGHRFSSLSDVEPVVHLYEDYGIEALAHVRGMFGLAVWDSRRRRLVLARDRLGMKPLYYAINNEVLCFGSEAKSILASRFFERRLDLEAVRDLCTFGYVAAPRSMNATVRRLRAGEFLVYERGQARTGSYWDVSFPENGEHRQISEAEWARRLEEKLIETVQIHLRSDVPVGSWLSGGLDSSAVTSLMRPFLEPPVRGFSLRFEAQELDEFRQQQTLDTFPEYTIRRRTAMLKTQDIELMPEIVWFCEECSITNIEIPRLLMSRLAAEEVKVVLSGEGADEVFGGYLYYFVDKVLRPIFPFPRALRRRAGALPIPWLPWNYLARVLTAPRELAWERFRLMSSPLNAHLLLQVLSPWLREEMGRLDSGIGLPLPDRFLRWHPFNQLQYLDMKLRLPNYINHRLDRMSMACSLEARLPFLDHELVELASLIPPRLQLKGLRGKNLLRRALRNWLPAEIVNRKKRALRAPRRQFFMSRLPETCAEFLTERALRDRGYFEPAEVRRFLKAHQEGRGDFSAVLTGALVIQIWDDLFLRQFDSRIPGNSGTAACPGSPARVRGSREV